MGPYAHWKTFWVHEKKKTGEKNTSVTMSSSHITRHLSYNSKHEIFQ